MPRGVKGSSPMTELVCAHCGKTFFRNSLLLANQIRRFGESPVYCSRACTHAGRTTDVRRKCLGCGVEFKVPSTKPLKKYCTQRCYATNSQRKNKNLGFGCLNSNGYHVVKRDGKNVKVHRLVMEKILGRDLRKGENVHHIDGNRANNTPANLELWTTTQPCGQRVIDKVAFAIAMLQQYPDFAAEAGFKLCKIGDCGCGH